jgi:hypothetical protein
MDNINILASRAIERAKNLQEFSVFRDIDEVVFDGNPIPYNLTHVMGEQIEITVPAIDQQEAETRVNEWLKGQRE